MGMTLRVDHERQRIVASGEGPPTYEEICGYVDAVRPHRLAGYDELFDATETVATLTAEQMRSLAVRAHQAPSSPVPWGLTAIVAREPAVFGLWRMYATLSEGAGVRVGVFYRLAEAEAWLLHPSGAGS
jgi:hypothetical protein